MFFPTEAIHQRILLYNNLVIARAILSYCTVRCKVFNTITHQQFLLLVKAFLKSLVGKKPVISQQEYDIFVINTRPRLRLGLV